MTKLNPIYSQEPDVLIKKHYTSKELAKILGITENLLTKLRINGKGPKYVKLGYRSIIYSAIEVEKYLNSHERLSTSDHGNNCMK